MMRGVVTMMIGGRGGKEAKLKRADGSRFSLFCPSSPFLREGNLPRIVQGQFVSRHEDTGGQEGPRIGRAGETKQTDSLQRSFRKSKSALPSCPGRETLEEGPRFRVRIANSNLASIHCMAYVYRLALACSAMRRRLGQSSSSSSSSYMVSRPEKDK